MGFLQGVSMAKFKIGETVYYKHDIKISREIVDVLNDEKYLIKDFSTEFDNRPYLTSVRYVDNFYDRKIINYNKIWEEINDC